jgi:hypothetical protein
VIPWLLVALIAVPVLIVAFVGARRRTVAFEHPSSEDPQAGALTDQELADAEVFEAKWHEEDKARYHEERLP